MTARMVVSEVWTLLRPIDRFHFLVTLAGSAWWVLDTIAGHPIGQLPDWVQAFLWGVTGVVIARLIILAAMVVSIIDDAHTFESMKAHWDFD